jgi:hypothetical protein
VVAHRWVDSGSECARSGCELGRAGSAELLDDPDEVGVLEPRGEEGPAVGAPPVGANRSGGNGLSKSKSRPWKQPSTVQAFITEPRRQTA